MSSADKDGGIIEQLRAAAHLQAHAIEVAPESTLLWKAADQINELAEDLEAYAEENARFKLARSSYTPAWIPVTERLPEPIAGRGSYESYSTGAVLVRHRDRPDYPVTAHAFLGELVGHGIGIPTNGASKHKLIAWYSVGRNLSNPFDMASTPEGKPFKDSAGYEKFLPNYFGFGITHWMPMPDASLPEYTPSTCKVCGKTPPFKGGTRCQRLDCGLIEWASSASTDTVGALVCKYSNIFTDRMNLEDFDKEFPILLTEFARELENEMYVSRQECAPDDHEFEDVCVKCGKPCHEWANERDNSALPSGDK